MWDKIIGAAIAIAATIFVSVIVYEIYVSYINLQQAQELAKNKSAGLSNVNKAIVSHIERGNANVLKIGLFNSSEKIAEINVKANQIDNDLSQGTVLFNY